MNKKALGTKIKYWLGNIMLHCYNGTNTSKHYGQLTILSNFACYTACTLVRRCYLAERDTSLTPLYGDDTAVLCSFKFSST